jgi:hypothetical protein
MRRRGIVIKLHASHHDHEARQWDARREREREAERETDRD